MRIYLKPRNNHLDFPRTCIDMDANGTVDHLITHLTLKYNTIDATTLEIFFRGRKLPFDSEIYKLNIVEDDELEVALKESHCCNLL